MTRGRESEAETSRGIGGTESVQSRGSRGGSPGRASRSTFRLPAEPVVGEPIDMCFSREVRLIQSDS